MDEKRLLELLLAARVAKIAHQFRMQDAREKCESVDEHTQFFEDNVLTEYVPQAMEFLDTILDAIKAGSAPAPAAPAG